MSTTKPYNHFFGTPLRGSEHFWVRSFGPDAIDVRNKVWKRTEELGLKKPGDFIKTNKGDYITLVGWGEKRDWTTGHREHDGSWLFVIRSKNHPAANRLHFMGGVEGGRVYFPPTMCKGTHLLWWDGEKYPRFLVVRVDENGTKVIGGSKVLEKSLQNPPLMIGEVEKPKNTKGSWVQGKPQVYQLPAKE